MLPRERTDLEMQKFQETSDSKVAIGMILSADSYAALDGRYVLINTGTTVDDSTETSNEATQLNALLAVLRTAGLLAP